MKRAALAIVAMATAGLVAAQTFTLKSDDLGGQFTTTQFANSFGCSGGNVSPQLHWESAPKETKAFAVTMYDLDAPTGSGFWHWVVYNIPASVTTLPASAGSTSKPALPKGALHGMNDAGLRGYLGPCPPAGTLHRYMITVHALKEPVKLDENAGPALTGFMLNQNTIAKASLLVYAQQ